MFNKTVNLGLITAILIVFNAFHYGESNHEKIPGVIYILLWTDLRREPFLLWSIEQKSLYINNCKFKNCYIVKDRDYFQDVMDYDSILFTPMGLKDYDLPKVRYNNQIYVFTCVEPAAYFPLNETWNYFFNYTWTYRLDSDVIYPSFFVTNRHGKRVGPQINAHWRNINRMKHTQKNIIDKLKNKTTAAALFVTRCAAMNTRLNYGQGLNEALKKYHLSVDFYGPCSTRNLKCLKNESRCLNLVEKNYYFYLAFENSTCEDYVSEELMIALGHYAVPVVLGGANYSSFMPDGIYLDGNILSEVKVAEVMNEAIQDKQKYYDYFKWHRYYTYRPAEGGDTDPLCEFCAFLNNESVRNDRRAYSDFDKWWNEYRTQRTTEVLIVYYENDASYTTRVSNISTPSILERTYNVFTNTFNGLFKKKSFFNSLF